jgi:protein associated with RNAse G/E
LDDDVKTMKEYEKFSQEKEAVKYLEELKMKIYKNVGKIVSWWD